MEISRIEADPGIPHATWVHFSPPGQGRVSAPRMDGKWVCLQFVIDLKDLAEGFGIVVGTPRTAAVGRGCSGEDGAGPVSHGAVAPCSACLVAWASALRLHDCTACNATGLCQRHAGAGESPPYRGCS